MWTKESREKVSNTLKGRHPSKETIQKLINKKIGIKRSEETKQKMSNSALLRWANTDPKIIKRKSQKLLGHKMNLGTYRSEETKKRMSESSKLAWKKRKQNLIGVVNATTTS